MPNNDNEPKALINVDLLLKSLLFACMFYILAHNDSIKLVKKSLGKVSQDNVQLVMMVLYAVLYYIINLFI